MNKLWKLMTEEGKKRKLSGTDAKIVKFVKGADNGDENRSFCCWLNSLWVRFMAHLDQFKMVLK